MEINMETITIKKLAEYCRDYIDLVSPSAMSRGGKRVCLTSDIFNAEPLLSYVEGINYDDQIILPVNLSTKIADLSIESEVDDGTPNEVIGRDLAIARELDNIYRKIETNSYTKQLSLQFGHISFKGIPIYEEDDEEFEASGHKRVEGYLFTVPIILNYKDSAGQRNYWVSIDDTLIKTNIGFVKNYLKLDYRDELYKFIALDSNEENSSIPISPAYIDALWSKIATYLKFSDAIEISDAPDLTDVIVALEPKANYFLSQDLTGIIQTADDDTLGKTALSAWVDKDDQYVTEPVDDTGNHEIFFPFAYDKYQLRVLSKINNKGLIVEGPPGTGKSQTISNMLVHLAATGKKVLFVSQKDQAVRGVKDKLKNLNIPCLFGYMPDRSSRLHTEQDERDSATYALRGIAQSHLDSVDEQDPKGFLASISTKVPSFNHSIDESRTFVQTYNEWISLDAFEFADNNLKITAEWYDKIQALRNHIDSTRSNIIKTSEELKRYSHDIGLEKQVLERVKDKIRKEHQCFKEATNYEWLQNEQEYIRGIGYDLLSRLTSEVIISFEKTVIDRKVNILSAKLNEFKLSKELDKTLQRLPIELFETYKTVIFSNNTKTERRLILEKIEKYFSSMRQLQDDLDKVVNKIQLLEQEQAKLEQELAKLENLLGEQNNQVSLLLLDDISMSRIDNLYAKHQVDLFSNVHRRYVLGCEVKNKINLNPNLVREEIMREKLAYDSQVKNYIRNRIAERAKTFRSQKQYRAALEGIARKLSMTKKAYKTFDQLKSDPFNFEAMSAVTPIWMMGLDDASRILPLKPNLFDYVIIDEASQCNIAYTLPVMYRAEHAIFFGDTLQMRDTTIAFKSNNQLLSLANKHKISEDLQIKAEGDSVKSVMDIAKLMGFETTVLKKHYRSPIELIGFSNENFYAPKNRKLEVVNDDVLTTEDGYVLKMHLLEANPDKEISSKSNLTEAIFIKQLVADLKASNLTKGKSIAILSFFNEQAELLRRVISDEDVKISAIEGIQGDERDIIIYSFVISSPKDKSRYIALTGEAGEIRKEINEGRVNVAFSRARLQVHAVTSLAPNLWPDGIWIKKYLNYIEEHGRIKRLTKVEQHFDSHFEEEVYNYLMQKLDISDYRISTQVESCGFKIDQVIKNIKTGKKLAIECDGPSHFDDGDGQVRVESDFERQLVLETAHWVFYRISYIDWQQNRESAKKDLIDAINIHFSKVEKPKTNDNESSHEEIDYEAITVEIPESIYQEQKDRAAKGSTRSYFGRPAINKKPDEEVQKPYEQNSSSLSSPSGGTTANGLSSIKNLNDSSSKDYVQLNFDQIDTISNEKASLGEQLEFGTSFVASSQNPSSGRDRAQSKEDEQIDDIISIVANAGIEFVDKRSNGGALWIVGGTELSEFVKECETKGFSFRFKLGGGKATEGKDAWWTK